jgi:hypothetical protein
MTCRILPIGAARALLATAALALLGACDSSPASAPDLDSAAGVALGTYVAQVTGGAGGARLAGSADASRGADGVDFRGVFQNLALGREAATGHYFTMIQLRSGDGGGLLLGHVAPNAELPNGTFGIEPGRNLRPPYDFVARYIERDANGRLVQLAARDGRVTVRAGETRIGGRFELRLEDGRTVSGSFAAITRR